MAHRGSFADLVNESLRDSTMSVFWMRRPAPPHNKLEHRSKPSDHIVLRVAIDCVMVMSPFPQGKMRINRAACKQTEVHQNNATLYGKRCLRTVQISA